MLLTGIIFIINVNAQVREQKTDRNKTDANIHGHILCNGEHVPFISVQIKGTTIGTTADETGHYSIVNIPEGKHIIRVSGIGYKAFEKEIEAKSNNSIELNFNLESDVLGIEGVVITGDRNELNRRESSVIVNTLTPVNMGLSQSLNMTEGLNYCSGLRVENNCQNCGFNQLRMNGLDGPYTQILINSRPIFSGLAGVYGLEMIPSNMVERVEIVRGGGSALYGSNAIAGTVNMILKDPITNSFEVTENAALTGIGMKPSGRPAYDNGINFNTSIVTANQKTGFSIYGFHRYREYFDANGDGYSELSKINNLTVGGRLFQRIGNKSKLLFDFFFINENRRGGNKFGELPHEADICESAGHKIFTGAITYELILRKQDLFSVYVSDQNVNRNSYYGALQSLKDYGLTKNNTLVAGAQYNAHFGEWSNLITGIEYRGEGLTDEKLGYPDIEHPVIINDSTVEIPHQPATTTANQKSHIYGVFAQYDINWKFMKISLGLRYDNYNINDLSECDADCNGNVVSPRLNLLFNIIESLQARISYSQGYRAPQIFDEDLHILSSGARRVLHVNAPGLKQETSHSIMASFDFNKSWTKLSTGITIEGFYTILEDPFTMEYGEPDENGQVIYTRTNAEEGARVSGFNLEFSIIPGKKFNFKAGFTAQKSFYIQPQDFDEKRFFRTPDYYGYYTLDWKVAGGFSISSSGTYTGPMLVPYFGPECADPDMGALKKTVSFFDMGIKLRYLMNLGNVKLQMFAGIKNILNSYQKDFDRGIDRDPGYIYGPGSPRTVYAGIGIGNLLR